MPEKVAQGEYSELPDNLFGIELVLHHHSKPTSHSVRLLRTSVFASLPMMVLF